MRRYAGMGAGLCLALVAPGHAQELTGFSATCQKALAERGVPQTRGFSFELSQALLQSGQCSLSDFSKMEALTGYDMSAEPDPLSVPSTRAAPPPPVPPRTEIAAERMLDDLLGPEVGPKDGSCEEIRSADGSVSVRCGGRKTWTWSNGKRKTPN